MLEILETLYTSASSYVTLHLMSHERQWCDAPISGSMTLAERIMGSIHETMFVGRRVEVENAPSPGCFVLKCFSTKAPMLKRGLRLGHCLEDLGQGDPQIEPVGLKR